MFIINYKNIDDEYRFILSLLYCLVYIYKKNYYIISISH